MIDDDFTIWDLDLITVLIEYLEHFGAEIAPTSRRNNRGNRGLFHAFESEVSQEKWRVLFRYEEVDHLGRLSNLESYFLDGHAVS